MLCFLVLEDWLTFYAGFYSGVSFHTLVNLRDVNQTRDLPFVTVVSIGKVFYSPSMLFRMTALDFREILSLKLLLQ